MAHRQLVEQSAMFSPVPRRERKERSAFKWPVPISEILRGDAELDWVQGELAAMRWAVDLASAVFGLAVLALAVSTRWGIL